MVGPSVPWAAIAFAFTLIPLTLIMYGLTFAHTPLAVLNVERVILERGACFGRCPVYRLTFETSGWAQYDGSMAVRYPGQYRAALARFDFERILTCSLNAAFLIHVSRG